MAASVDTRQPLEAHDDNSQPQKTDDGLILDAHTCPFCQLIIANADQLQQHISEHLKNVSQRKIINHIKRRASTVTCELCGSIHNNLQILERHMKNVHGADVPKCSICSKIYANQKELIKHMNQHDPEVKMNCEICHIKFENASQLTPHLVEHLGPTSKKCPICFNVYGSNHTVRKHMRIHSGERPFHCGICQMYFFQEWDVARHVLTKSHMNKKGELISQGLPAPEPKVHSHLMITAKYAYFRTLTKSSSQKAGDIKRKACNISNHAGLPPKVAKNKTSNPEMSNPGMSKPDMSNQGMSKPGMSHPVSRKKNKRNKDGPSFKTKIKTSRHQVVKERAKRNTKQINYANLERGSSDEDLVEDMPRNRVMPSNRVKPPHFPCNRAQIEMDVDESPAGIIPSVGDATIRAQPNTPLELTCESVIDQKPQWTDIHSSVAPECNGMLGNQTHPWIKGETTPEYIVKNTAHLHVPSVGAPNIMASQVIKSKGHIGPLTVSSQPMSSGHLKNLLSKEPSMNINGIPSFSTNGAMPNSSQNPLPAVSHFSPNPIKLVPTFIPVSQGPPMKKRPSQKPEVFVPLKCQSLVLPQPGTPLSPRPSFSFMPQDKREVVTPVSTAAIVSPPALIITEARSLAPVPHVPRRNWEDDVSLPSQQTVTVTLEPDTCIQSQGLYTPQNKTEEILKRETGLDIRNAITIDSDSEDECLKPTEITDAVKVEHIKEEESDDEFSDDSIDIKPNVDVIVNVIDDSHLATDPDVATVIDDSLLAKPDNSKRKVYQKSQKNICYRPINLSSDEEDNVKTKEIPADSRTSQVVTIDSDSEAELVKPDVKGDMEKHSQSAGDKDQFVKEEPGLEGKDVPVCIPAEAANVYMCVECGMDFSSPSALDQHMLIHEEEEEEDPSALVILQEDGSSAAYMCVTCCKMFTTKASLESHKSDCEA